MKIIIRNRFTGDPIYTAKDVENICQALTETVGCWKSLSGAKSMTLYDEYRREFPIATEPSEFRGIIEAEVRRALEWMRVRDKPPLPDSVSDWAEADFKRANDLMAPLFDKIVEYESMHYPIDEPSREEAEAFRREQEEGLPAEDIKPGRYMMMTEVIVENCCHAGIGCGMKCHGLVFGFPNASANRCLESLVNGDATFQAVEG